MAKVFLSYKYQDNPYDPVGYFLERAFKNLGHEVYHEAVSGLDLAIFLPPSACNQDMKNNELGGVPVFYWEIDSTRKKKLEPLGAYDQLFIDNKEQDVYYNGIFLPVAADLEFTRRFERVFNTREVIQKGNKSNGRESSIVVKTLLFGR